MDEDFQVDAAPVPSLTPSPSFKTYSNPRKTTKTGEAYILQIACTSSHYAAAASAPSNAIYLFDKGSLDRVKTLAGHQNGLSALSVSPAGNHALFSCGKDGSVKMWDERTGVATVEMRASGRPRGFLSLDISRDGQTVATGTELAGDDVSIHFFDIRNPAAPLRSHSQTHSEDITVVKFAPAAHDGGRLLLSASSDGLVCTSNPDEQDEDEAGVHVGNWGCSIAQAGWITGYAKGAPAIWAASDMETFSLWTEELDVVQTFDVRRPTMSGRVNWTTDYFIGAHVSPSRINHLDNGLRLFLGSNEGTLALVSPASSPAAPSLSIGVEAKVIQAWTSHAHFDGPHSGVVRAACWDEQAEILLTGGEDGKLCAWSCPSLPVENVEMDEDAGSGLGGRGVIREMSEADGDDMDVDGTSLSPQSGSKRSRKDAEADKKDPTSPEHMKKKSRKQAHV